MSRDFGDFSQAHIEKRSAKRMAAIDALPASMRAVVHEYGYMIVSNFLNCGVKKPEHIRHLVETVLNEFSPTRGSYSRQGIRTDAVSHPKAQELEQK